VAEVRRLVRRGDWLVVDRWRSSLLESEHWSPEQLAEHQLEQFKRILDHAATHVPLYRKRFNAAGLVAADVQSLADIVELPMVTKADLQSHLEELAADNVKPTDRDYITSGGSTGIPVGFYADR